MTFYGLTVAMLEPYGLGALTVPIGAAVGGLAAGLLAARYPWKDAWKYPPDGPKGYSPK